MGYVEEWQKPLEEALGKRLGDPDLSAKELEEVQQIMGRMDCSQDLTEQLSRRIAQQEHEYAEAADLIETSSDRKAIAAALEKMTRLNGYKNADEKISLAEKKIEEIKEQERLEQERKEKRARKIKRIAASVAAVCAAVGVVALFLRVQQRNKRIDDIKTQLLALIDQGKEDEIGDLLKDLTELNASRDDLYEMSEQALESVAGREGFAAAFALRDALSEEVDGAVDERAFGAWTDEQVTSGSVSPEEGWVIALDALSSERLSETDEVVRTAFNACLESVVSKAQSGDAGELMTWISRQGSYLLRLPVNGQLAVETCRTLEEAGEDLAAVFPDGILVDIPVGSQVGTLTAWLGREDESYIAPDMTKMLPVAITEKTENGFWQMHEQRYSSEADLNAAIEKLQKQDDHYTVRFLPAYYKDMPEDLRADTFDACTCLVAMQESYFLRGYTYTEKVKGVTRTYDDYQGTFVAVDCIAFYDLSDPNRFVEWSVEGHDPLIANEVWYNASKNTADFILHSDKYRYGTHDEEGLMEDYQKVIGDLHVIKLISELAGMGEGEENEDL